MGAGRQPCHAEDSLAILKSLVMLTNACHAERSEASRRPSSARPLAALRVTSIGQPCISIADSLSRWYTLGSIKGVLTTPVTLQGRAETGTEEGCE
jgi:hypothetical protein